MRPEENEEIIYDSVQKKKADKWDDVKQHLEEWQLKARQWDEMQKSIEGDLYRLFVQQMQCKIDYVACLHKGYGGLQEIGTRLETLDYAIIKTLAGAMEKQAQTQIPCKEGGEERP